MCPNQQYSHLLVAIKQLNRDQIYIIQTELHPTSFKKIFSQTNKQNVILLAQFFPNRFLPLNVKEQNIFVSQFFDSRELGRCPKPISVKETQERLWT